MSTISSWPQARPTARNCTSKAGHSAGLARSASSRIVTRPSSRKCRLFGPALSPRFPPSCKGTSPRSNLSICNAALIAFTCCPLKPASRQAAGQHKAISSLLAQGYHTGYTKRQQLSAICVSAPAGRLHLRSRDLEVMHVLITLSAIAQNHPCVSLTRLRLRFTSGQKFQSHTC